MVACVMPRRLRVVPVATWPVTDRTTPAPFHRLAAAAAILALLLFPPSENRGISTAFPAKLPQLPGGRGQNGAELHSVGRGCRAITPCSGCLPCCPPAAAASLRRVPALTTTRPSLPSQMATSRAATRLTRQSAKSRALARTQVAVGETFILLLPPLPLVGLIMLPPPSPFRRCFNIDGEVASAK